MEVQPTVENMLIELVESVDHPCTTGGLLAAPGVLRGKLLQGGLDLVEDMYVVELPSGEQVNVHASDIRFDEEAPIRPPWHGTDTLLVSAPDVSAPLHRFLTNTPVPGLTREVFNTYRMYGVCILFFGGAVRAALLRNSMLTLKDVDVIFGTSPRVMLDIANEVDMRPVIPVSYKVQWGRDRSSRMEATMEGAPMCPERNTYADQVSETGTSMVSNSLGAHLLTLDFTCNAVLYEPLTDTFIDCSGFGIHDVLTSTLRITAPLARWDDWVGDNGLKMLRYWKMQHFGFVAADRETHDFIVQNALVVVPDTDVDTIVQFIRGSLMHGKPTTHRIAREDFRAYNSLLCRDVHEYCAAAEYSGRAVAAAFLSFWWGCVEVVAGDDPVFIDFVQPAPVVAAVPSGDDSGDGDAPEPEAAVEAAACAPEVAE